MAFVASTGSFRGRIARGIARGVARASVAASTASVTARVIAELVELDRRAHVRVLRAAMVDRETYLVRADRLARERAIAALAEGKRAVPSLVPAGHARAAEHVGEFDVV